MITKTSIRFFNNKPVRARWDDSTESWWYAATDLITAFTGNTIIVLFGFCIIDIIWTSVLFVRIGEHSNYEKSDLV